ncbi:hypothetical protein CPB85DRAFT_1366500 [Mucidula mucida]|nr:hypothetical protein CPB85DRAFT_1366500 [Mucidula mucida]
MSNQILMLPLVDWIPSGTKEDRRAKASRAKGSPAPTPPASQGAAAPDSQSSTASVSLPKRVRIVRVNDGMVFARAKLSYLQEMMPGSDLTSAPALPALSLEDAIENACCLGVGRLRQYRDVLPVCAEE